MTSKLSLEGSREVSWVKVESEEPDEILGAFLGRMDGKAWGWRWGDQEGAEAGIQADRLRPVMGSGDREGPGKPRGAPEMGAGLGATSRAVRIPLGLMP